jgi:hypothetical protein
LEPVFAVALATSIVSFDIAVMRTDQVICDACDLALV